MKQARVFFISISAGDEPEDYFYGAVVTRAVDNDAAMDRLKAFGLLPAGKFQTIVMDITPVFRNEHPFDKLLSKEDLEAVGPIVPTSADELEKVRPVERAKIYEDVIDLRAHQSQRKKAYGQN